MRVARVHLARFNQGLPFLLLPLHLCWACSPAPTTLSSSVGERSLTEVSLTYSTCKLRVESKQSLSFSLSLSLSPLSFSLSFLFSSSPLSLPFPPSIVGYFYNIDFTRFIEAVVLPTVYQGFNPTLTILLGLLLPLKAAKGCGLITWYSLLHPLHLQLPQVCWPFDTSCLFHTN